MAAIETDTGEIGTAGVGLSNISLPAGGLDSVVLSDMAAGAPAEPGSMSMVDFLSYLYALYLNKAESDTSGSPSEKIVYRRDESTKMFEQTLTDAANVFTRGEARVAD